MTYLPNWKFLFSKKLTQLDYNPYYVAHNLASWAFCCNRTDRISFPSRAFPRQRWRAYHPNPDPTGTSPVTVVLLPRRPRGTRTLHRGPPPVRGREGGLHPGYFLPDTIFGRFHIYEVSSCWIFVCFSLS